MKFFDELGACVASEWRRVNFDEAAFPAVAAEALARRRPSDHVTADQIANWVLTASTLPAQGDLKNPFGNPPLVLFRHDRFYIEALFWVDSTTSIHQHDFNGAFHVLQGSSIHAGYQFSSLHHFSERLMIGTLDAPVVSVLHKGAIQSIISGTEFVHSLFHLERPSVSIVVRTGRAAFAGPQYDYLFPRIAFDSKIEIPLLTRQLQILEMLQLCEPDEFREHARRKISDGDAFTAFHVLRRFGSRMPVEELRTLITGIEREDSILLPAMVECAEELARQRTIIARRSRVHNAQHRFFLALLLNVRERGALLRAVSDQFPSASPTETVRRWVREMAGVRLPDGVSALGVNLDESSLEILGYLVDGNSDAEIIRRLSADFGSVTEMQEEIKSLCEVLRNSYTFSSLFRSNSVEGVRSQ